MHFLKNIGIGLCVAHTALVAGIIAYEVVMMNMVARQNRKVVS